MKERPIILKPWEVKAVLAGDKTQLRRVMSPQPSYDFGWYPGCGNDGKSLHYANERHFIKGVVIDFNPYGKVRERLWVREKFSPVYPQDMSYNNGNPIEYDYAATYKNGDRLGDFAGIKKQWKSPVQMPRSASRILLEIKNVRVERLRDIDHENISDNGISDFCNEDCGYPFLNPATGSYYDNADSAYIDMWEFDHGAGSWELNPWVWVIDFVRIGHGTR